MTDVKKTTTYVWGDTLDETYKRSDILCDFMTESNKKCLIFRDYSHISLSFLRHFYIKSSIIIQDGLDNPNNNNVEYIRDMIGTQFVFSKEFVSNCVNKLFKEVDTANRNRLAELIFENLTWLHSTMNKTEGSLSGTFIKYIYWLNYKFKYVINYKNDKVIYNTKKLSLYELSILNIIAQFNNNIVILCLNDDKFFNDIGKLKDNVLFYQDKHMEPLRSSEFFYYYIKQPVTEFQKISRVFGVQETEKKYKLKESIFKDEDFIKGSFSTLEIGVPWSDFKDNFFTFLDKNNFVVIEDITTDLKVMPNEISSLHRSNSSDIIEKSKVLASNFNNISNKINLMYLIRNFYQDVTIDKIMKEEVILKVVALLKRYENSLDNNNFLINIKGSDEFNMLAFKFMYALRIVIRHGLIVFNGDKRLDFQNKWNKLRLVVNDVNINEFSVDATKLPTKVSDLKVSTVAYNAEKEIQDIIYDNETLFKRDNAIKLNVIGFSVMFEEIKTYWNEVCSMRTGFKVDKQSNRVLFPVMFQQIRGIRDKNVNDYCLYINELVNTPDTIFINDSDYFGLGTGLGRGTNVTNLHIHDNRNVREYQYRAFAGVNGFNRDLLKRNYEYSYLSDSVQDLIIDKILELIQLDVFKDVNASSILTVGLNLSKDILQLLQGFDYTKRNPKVVYWNTTESMLQQGDCIMLHLLYLLGFDVLMFIPTGYNVVDNWVKNPIYDRVEYGDYMFNINKKFRDRAKGFFGRFF